MDVIKEHIISKSYELFNQVGVKVATMDMISKELNISKRTLYEHFSSKEELIKQTFNKCLVSSILELENKIKNYQNAVHQNFLILENIHSLYFLKKNLVTIQLKKFFPEIYYEITTTQKQSIKNFLKKNISLGIEEGLYRSKINKRLTIEYYYLVEQIFSDENNSSDVDLTDTSIKNFFMNLLIRSITTKKGIKELDRYSKIKLDI